ncbi:MAG: hypothetical protein ABI451_10055 [Dokdonella sp.]
MHARSARLFVLTLLALSLPVFAAPARTVTIVVKQNGAPVAGARVMIAADEKDAIGKTDAQGKMTLSTTSAKISVTADKGTGKGSASGTDALLNVALAGGAQ